MLSVVFFYLAYSMIGVRKIRYKIQESFKSILSDDQPFMNIIVLHSCLSVFGHCQYTLRPLLHIRDIVKLSLSFFFLCHHLWRIKMNRNHHHNSFVTKRPTGHLQCCKLNKMQRSLSQIMGRRFAIFPTVFICQHKELDGKYSERVQIPAKAFLSPTLDNTCHTYYFAARQFRISRRSYFVNNRRFTEFFDRYFHTPLPIITKHEPGLPFPPRNPRIKFGANPSTFLVIAVKDRHTDTQTNAGENIFSLALAGIMKVGNANLSPSSATKLVAMATSLYQSLPNFQPHEFFVDGVKCNNPRCDPSTRYGMRGGDV